MKLQKIIKEVISVLLEIDEKPIHHVYDDIIKQNTEYDEILKTREKEYNDKIIQIFLKYKFIQTPEEYYIKEKGKRISFNDFWKWVENQPEDIQQDIKNSWPDFKKDDEIRRLDMKNHFDKINQIEKESRDAYALQGDKNAKYIYHYTNFEYAYEIITDNTLYDFGNDVPGISLTTNPNLHKRGFVFWHPGEYTEGKHHKNIPVIFKLDFENIKKSGFKFKLGSEEIGTHPGEEEIRLRTDSLPDFKSYLVGIILVKSAVKNEIELQKFISLLKKEGITYFVRN